MDRYVEARRKVQASAQDVWAVITDPARIVGLQAGITSLEGQIVPGGRFKLTSDVAPKRVFHLKVEQLDAPRAMIWRGGMPFGLFTGRRRFMLTPDGATTSLHMREDFTGPLAGMIWNSMPDLQPSMDRLIDAITTAAQEVRS